MKVAVFTVFIGLTVGVVAQGRDHEAGRIEIPKVEIPPTPTPEVNTNPLVLPEPTPQSIPDLINDHSRLGYEN